MKIIHIVENLDKGAVENWLVRIFLESRKMRPDWKWTFFCILGREGRLDDSVRAAGGEIIYTPCTISDKIPFLRFLRKTLQNGKYNIIHSHHDYLSGFYLLASYRIYFRKRLLQIHNTDKALPVGNKILHQILLGVFKKTAIYFSDVIIGISKNVLDAFVEGKRFPKKSLVLLYYGIDMKPFAPDSSIGYVQREFNIPENGKVLLFVGRMNDLKNPGFVVDVLQKITERRNDVYALFVGKGDEEITVIKKASENSLMDKVRLSGWRDDTSSIMKSADVFIFPRLEFPKEGLGLVVVEAQAAALPMVLTTGIVEDAIEIEELAHILPLRNNPEQWAETIDRILNEPALIGKNDIYNRMLTSKFELKKATENFIDLYES